MQGGGPGRAGRGDGVRGRRGGVAAAPGRGLADHRGGPGARGWGARGGPQPALTPGRRPTRRTRPTARGSVGGPWCHRGVAFRGTGTEIPPHPGSAPVYRLIAGEPPGGSRPRLDPTQQAVVDHPGGPLLVLAGPGTGKTTTIVEAVAHRIERGVDPEQILVLTFSRKAAAELRTRVTARVAQTIREPLARTLHSYAFGVLRRAALLRGDPPPRLLTAAEQDAVLAQLLRGDVEEEGAVRWPADLAPALGTAGFRTELRELLLRATERGVVPDRLARWGRDSGRDAWVHAAAFQEQYEAVTAFATAARGDASGYDPAELVRAAIIE